MFLSECVRIPFWHFLKLILVGCLVAPYFDGSVYVYKHIIRPCLSADPQVVINMFIKLKELFLEKYNLLVVIERDVIKEHEPEALENLIAFKVYMNQNFVEKIVRYTLEICSVYYYSWLLVHY